MNPTILSIIIVATVAAILPGFALLYFERKARKKSEELLTILIDILYVEKRLSQYELLQARGTESGKEIATLKTALEKHRKRLEGFFPSEKDLTELV